MLCLNPQDVSKVNSKIHKAVKAGRTFNLESVLLLKTS